MEYESFAVWLDREMTDAAHAVMDTSTHHEQRSLSEKAEQLGRFNAFAEASTEFNRLVMRILSERGQR